jgi:hypothetical protein
MSEPHRSPGQEQWPSSGTPQVDRITEEGISLPPKLAAEDLRTLRSPVTNWPGYRMFQLTVPKGRRQA